MNAPIRQTSTLAVVSLVFGILGWTLLPFLGSLVAVVCGHMARGEIRRAQGNLEGGGAPPRGRGAPPAARGPAGRARPAPPPDWCWATS